MGQAEIDLARADVEHKDSALAITSERRCERHCDSGRLVDEADDVKTSDPTGMHYRLSLGLTEEGWHGGDCVVYSDAELGFCIATGFVENLKAACSIEMTTSNKVYSGKGLANPTRWLSTGMSKPGQIHLACRPFLACFKN